MFSRAGMKKNRYVLFDLTPSFYSYTVTWFIASVYIADMYM